MTLYECRSYRAYSESISTYIVDTLSLSHTHTHTHTQMRKTEGVSVFPVAFSGGLAVEGPVCEDGKAVKWIASYAPQRYMYT